MIARLVCWWKGKHVRGKFLRAEDNGRVKVFSCPRCKRENALCRKGGRVTKAQDTLDDESAADGVQFFTGGPIHYFENEDDAYERSRGQEDF